MALTLEEMERLQNEQVFGGQTTNNRGGRGGGRGNKYSTPDPDETLLAGFRAMAADAEDPLEVSEQTFSEQFFKNQQAENEMMFGPQSDPTTVDEFRKGRSLSLLTDDALKSLSDDRIFPSALQSDLPGNPISESQFQQIENPSDRLDYLKEARDFQIQEVRRQESIDEFMNNKWTAVGGGIAGGAVVAVGSLAAAKAVIAGAGIKGLATLVGDYAVGAGMNAARMVIPQTARQIPGKAFGLAVA